MKIIVCELCEGREFTKQDGMFICKSCGTQYSPEEARKMMKEVEADTQTDPVAASSNNALEKYLLLARRAKEANDSGAAAEYYALAKMEDPNSWECAFYSVYFKALETNIANMASAANLISNSLKGVVALIKSFTPQELQRAAALELKDRCIAASTMFYTAARNTYNKIQYNQADYYDEMQHRSVAARNISVMAGDCLWNEFGTRPDIEDAFVALWIHAVNMWDHDHLTFRGCNVDSEIAKISAYDHSYISPKQKMVNNELQKHIDAIDKKIEKLKQPKWRFEPKLIIPIFVVIGIIILAIIFIRYKDIGEFVTPLVIFPCAGLCVLFSLLRFTKNEKRLAKDKMKIEKLMEQKAALEEKIKK